MEKTKAAFLLKIGERYVIASKEKIVCLIRFLFHCHIVFNFSLEDRGMFVSASEDEVNVLTSGYSFLLKIFHERGLALQKPG
jgi:U3 small nucleolar RNA-associated protein 22